MPPAHGMNRGDEHGGGHQLPQIHMSKYSSSVAETIRAPLGMSVSHAPLLTGYTIRVAVVVVVLVLVVVCSSSSSGSIPIYLVPGPNPTNSLSPNQARKTYSCKY